MDISRALDRLGLSGENWGPDISSLTTLRKGWRGNVPLPLSRVIEDELAAILQDDEAQALEDKRAEVIRAIKDEGLRRIQLQEPEWDTFDEVRLIASIWTLFSAGSSSAPFEPASATAPQLIARDIYIHAKARITSAKTATRKQLDAYDPATDRGWPDN